jgi:hypothetical protein
METKNRVHFVQDSATAHTANKSVNVFIKVIGERVINEGQRAAISPLLNPYDFCLRGTLRDELQAINSHPLRQLKENIRQDISVIHKQQLRRVSRESISRCETAEKK